MEAGIHIGNRVDKISQEALGELIVKVFTTGRETGMDQSTICKALDIIQRVSDVNSVSVCNNVIGRNL